MDENTKDALQLLNGLQTGKLRVKSYSSQWIMKGMKPINRRKMTLIIEEVHQ